MFANECTGFQEGDSIRNRPDLLGGFSAGESSPEGAVDDDEGEAVKASRQVCGDQVVIPGEGLTDELGKAALAEEVIVMDVWSPSRMSTPESEMPVHQQVGKERTD